MSKQPLVSIILPTYNRAAFLGKTIDSVLAQTYPNWELLVVDDGSKDSTREMVSAFCARDGRIKYFALEKNQGASAARNHGIDKSAGDFITFIDSDDQYDPQKVRKQIEKFLVCDSKVGVITCGRRDFNSEGKLYKEWVPGKRGDVRMNMFRDERIGAGTPFLMARREAVGNVVRFDTKINVVEDFDFLMQILQQGYTLDFVAEPLVDVYHYGGIERNFSYERAFDAREYLYKKYDVALRIEDVVRSLFLFKTLIFYATFEKPKPKAVTVREFKRKYRLTFFWILIAKGYLRGRLKNALLALIKYFFVAI